MTRKSHASVPGAALPAEGPAEEERASNLIRSMLDFFPVDQVLDVVADYVRRTNRADEMLATLALRGERAKPRIAERSGLAWSTEEVAEKVGMTAETIRNRVALGKLIAYPAIGDRTRWRLPAWQFHKQDRGYGVHEWVPELIGAFGANGWGLVDFVTVPRTHLDGRSYLHLLQSDRWHEVVASAKRGNPDRG